MIDYDYKLLRVLDTLIQECKLCSLHIYGRAKPYWTRKSRYGIFLEAPGKIEVEKNTPVMGPAGKKLWAALSDIDLYREDFLIVNSVNCRPVTDNKNGKPTSEEISSCSDWVRKYIRIVKPQKILVMGKYAIDSFNGILKQNLLPSDSIVENNGRSTFVEFYGIPITVVISVHPAYTIYNPVGGTAALSHSLKIFRSL